MSDNRTKYCKMSDNCEPYDKMLENRETADKMLESREKYWQFPEAALAADWKWGCGGRSPPSGARTKFGMPYVRIYWPVNKTLDNGMPHSYPLKGAVMYLYYF